MSFTLGGDFYNTLGQHSNGSGDEIRLGDDAVITGDVHSDYLFDVGSATVEGSLFINTTGTTGGLTIDGGTVGGDVHAIDGAIITSGSTIGGDVRVDGDLEIDASTNVTGDVYVTGEITGETDGVQGNASEGIEDAETEEPTDKIQSEPGTRWYPTEGEYDELPDECTDSESISVKGGDTCSVESGIYKADSLVVENDGTLELDTSDGVIILHITGDFGSRRGHRLSDLTSRTIRLRLR
ncbi:hypothetical protein ACFQMM_01070 [Saliphagus sp. GCM10025308]